MLPSVRFLTLILALAFLYGEVRTDPPSPPAPISPAPSVIVIGFVGGFVHHDDRIHAEVRLADRLREEFAPAVDVETFENHRGKEAHQTVLRLLHGNRPGPLSPEEKQNARIIIFGHSWGASETVELARRLQTDGIPVILTIQVDSVQKFRQNDAVIPPNVAQAANFFQLDGFLHGRAQIRAADPSRTRILGNFRSSYKSKPFACGQYPWYDRAFMKPHIQIECDPAVWQQVESLIRSNLFLEARVPPTSAISTPVSRIE
jgi:hypothetical protein